jgi:hypothetical protein
LALFCPCGAASQKNNGSKKVRKMQKRVRDNGEKNWIKNENKNKNRIWWRR